MSAGRAAGLRVGLGPDVVDPVTVRTADFVVVVEERRRRRADDDDVQRRGRRQRRPAVVARPHHDRQSHVAPAQSEVK